MSMERDSLDALEDILQNMELAKGFMGDAPTIEDLEADSKTLYSVVRALEVLGEAAKRNPEVEPRVRLLLERSGPGS